MSAAEIRITATRSGGRAFEERLGDVVFSGWEQEL